MQKLKMQNGREIYKEEMLKVFLEWASKQAFMVQDPKVEELLHESKGKLELYQFRGFRGLC